ncbi:hypothetical protein [Bradyrhizobium liaoningense]|uniref:hypothetical protein n=1 Tax=Bradyrhizobium liaoningense TaxID=43992 RepID=UPI001BACB6B7|nr:hypothetical protein [Bradyrhizobium liaoningense]MBR0712688.1 hypothetical protein [Bradyrhizobium liaoningense]
MLNRGGATVEEVAVLFSVSTRTAYRVAKEVNAAPYAAADRDISALFGMTPVSEQGTGLRERIAELRGRKGPSVEAVIEAERVTVTRRAKDALDAAHSRLADSWRKLHEDQDAGRRDLAECRAADAAAVAAERKAVADELAAGRGAVAAERREIAAQQAFLADLMNRVRVRVAKTDGPWLPASFSMAGHSMRYSALVTFGARSAPQPAPAALPVTVPWETAAEPGTGPPVDASPPPEPLPALLPDFEFNF